MPVLGGQESQVILGLYIPESNGGGKEFKKKKKKETKTENKSCNKCEAFWAFSILLGPGEMAY